MDGSQDPGVLQSAGCHPTTFDSEASKDLRSQRLPLFRSQVGSLQGQRWTVLRQLARQRLDGF